MNGGNQYGKYPYPSIIIYSLLIRSYFPLTHKEQIGWLLLFTKTSQNQNVEWCLIFNANGA